MFKAITSSFGKLKSLFPPIREVLSEDGVGSYSRYTGFMIVVAVLVWVSFLVIKNHALPDLEGPAIFVSSGQTQYGLNQMKKVAAAVKRGPGPDPDPNPTPDNPDAPGGTNASS